MNNKRKMKKKIKCLACNPSSSGGRDQEDNALKLAWANSSRDPISKKTYHKKRAGRVAFKV
jgi:hypothetical protein